MIVKVKSHFTSRYGNEGVLVKADWSSLELIIWAFLTKDPMLRELILSGRDMHRYVGSMVLGCKEEEIDKETRDSLKARNFLLVYGGYWYELVRAHGMSEKDAEKLYNTFWSLFPVARAVQEGWVKEVEANAKLIDEYTPLGQQKHEGFVKSISGREYYFKTYDNSAYWRSRGVMTKFKKPEICNAPIQGFATADMQIIAIGHMFRKSLEHRDKFLMINTVHDDTMFDVRKKHLNFVLHLIKKELQYVKVVIKERLGLEIDLPLNIELAYGKSWAEMLKWDGEEVKI